MMLVSCVSAWYQAYFILLRWRIFQGNGGWCVGVLVVGLHVIVYEWFAYFA